MQLAQSYERHVFGCERAQEFAAILRDTGSRVPIGETQVKDVGLADFAFAAGARAESMNEPGNRDESIGDEKFDTPYIPDTHHPFDMRAAAQAPSGA